MYRHSLCTFDAARREGTVSFDPTVFAYPFQKLLPLSPLLGERSAMTCCVALAREKVRTTSRSMHCGIDASMFCVLPVHMLSNWSAHADTQHQVAAARQLLRAGGLQR